MCLNKIDATGVYVGHIERIKKTITDESNDHGHVDDSAPLIIRYVSACEDHKFMVDKTMPAEGTVTYSIFHPTTEAAGGQPGGDQADADPNAERKEGESEPKQEPEGIPNKFVPEVTKETKLKFFKVPRLGCYLAISLKYNSCLYDTSLDKAVEAYYETLQRKEKQAKEIQEHEEKQLREKEDKEAAGEVFQPTHVDWPKITEPPYATHEREYLLCIDTLGQDRMLTEEERKFAIDIAKLVIKCWEDSENEALAKDKALRISFKTRDDEYKEKELGEVNDAIEKSGEEALADETL